MVLIHLASHSTSAGVVVSLSNAAKLLRLMLTKVMIVRNFTEMWRLSLWNDFFYLWIQNKFFKKKACLVWIAFISVCVYNFLDFLQNISRFHNPVFHGVNEMFLSTT